MGTIERISTTGTDCAAYFQRQLKALGFEKFVACDNGQLSIENPDCRQGFEWMSSDIQKLKVKIQQFLDSDSLGSIHIRGEHTFPDGEVDYHWWRIQFRNLH